MPNTFLIGLGLGLVSAAVFASALTGNIFVQYFLLVLVPLPIFLAGLGWGSIVAAVAALSGTVLAVLWAGPTVGLTFLAIEGGPAVVLSHLALQSRPAPATAESSDAKDWYPAGRLVIWAALIAGSIALASIYMLGSETDALKTAMKAILEQFLKSNMADAPAKAPLTPEQIDKIADAFVRAAPAVFALSWMSSLLFNLWLAGRITLASGHLKRPWPDLGAIEYPRGTALALAGVLLASTTSGWPAAAATSFAGSLFAAYVLMGLAVVHYASRGKSWRPFALWALYAGLLLVNAGVAIFVALLGLAEPILKLRHRHPPPMGGPAT